MTEVEPFASIIEYISDSENISKAFLYTCSGLISLFIYKKIKEKIKSKKKLELIKTSYSQLGFIKLMKNDAFLDSFNFKKKKRSLNCYSLPSGIVNYGNNCYVNVFLQCISSLNEFIEYSSLEINSSIVSFTNLLRDINCSKIKILHPHDFISDICSQFEFANEQQDSYELFHRIMDLYKIDENSNPLIIKLKTKFYCPNCKMTLEKEESHLDLNVSNNTNVTKSLQSEINNFEQVSVIEDYICASCTINNLLLQLNQSKHSKLIEYLKSLKARNDNLENMVEEIVEYTDKHNMSDVAKTLRFKPIRTNLQKSTSIFKTRKNLIIHLDSVNYLSGGVKSSAKVIFNEFLMIKNRKYELMSFIQHMGSSGFGHYICYRKFYSGLWCVVNDTNVKFLTSIEIFGSTQPYMMFYREVFD